MFDVATLFRILSALACICFFKKNRYLLPNFKIICIFFFVYNQEIVPFLFGRKCRLVNKSTRKVSNLFRSNSGMAVKKLEHKNNERNCILKVDTRSSGWEKSLTKVIKRVKDVSYSIDAAHGVVRISGEINPNKLLNNIKKAGKHVELIHAECGDGYSCYNHGYGYDYEGRYGKVESLTYPYYEAHKQGIGYNIQTYSHPCNGFPAPEAKWRHFPLLQSPSAPPLDYDPYNSSCNIM
ncbi:hypothetical protein VNO77_18141 [Canavalia gladiata]|uniref:HMA domain-containing protein n=1 Tax=Canavalia gladiata TaxID=3824 RepID=A0AAN9LK98_CANGL